MFCIRNHLRRSAALTRSATTTTTTTTRVESWPDGTPKKFQGKESWKNWINYDTKHDNLTDELNRLRHFFWEVDTRGKLWRLEIDELDGDGHVVGAPRRCGQMREPKILDFFFPHVYMNDTQLYQRNFPFVVRRAHEMYFCRTTWDPTNSKISPIVFNNLAENHTTLRHSCPGTGHVVCRLDTTFDPSLLRTDVEGRLFHPVATVEKVSKTGVVKQRKNNEEQQQQQRWGLLESAVVQTIASDHGEMEMDEETMDTTLLWNGTKYPLLSF